MCSDVIQVSLVILPLTQGYSVIFCWYFVPVPGVPVGSLHAHIQEYSLDAALVFLISSCTSKHEAKRDEIESFGNKRAPEFTVALFVVVHLATLLDVHPLAQQYLKRDIRFSVCKTSYV